jgi:prepilin-type N-terminal cleavage/methylation domain-containing protein
MRRPTRPAAGYSIIELLIALIIISILVSMVILVASQRTAEARLRAAESDMRIIAEAEQSAVKDFGYFLRFYVLDDITGDLPSGSTDPTPTFGPKDPNDIFDLLIQEQLNDRNPDGEQYGIEPDFGSLPSSTTSTQAGGLRPANTLVNSVVRESTLGVLLPYISFRREYTDDAGNYFNVPMDPWGNPYVIMTRQGFINDIGSTLFTPDQGLIPAGTAVNVAGTGAFATDRFDRFTIISFGPDAVPGDGGIAGTNIGEGDDLTLKLN